MSRNGDCSGSAIANQPMGTRAGHRGCIRAECGQWMACVSVRFDVMMLTSSRSHARGRICCVAGIGRAGCGGGTMNSVIAGATAMVTGV